MSKAATIIRNSSTFRKSLIVLSSLIIVLEMRECAVRFVGKMRNVDKVQDERINNDEWLILATSTCFHIDRQLVMNIR